MKLSKKTEELIDTDKLVLEVQREQLAGMDLMLLSNQVIDILLEDRNELEERVLAFNLTFARLKQNLVAGALAVAELESLKKS